MKSLDQIVRYASHCRFSDDDWVRVLDYCRNLFGGGKIHKAQNPVSSSTYEQFIEWVDAGVGAGDIVRYGHTIGIVGSYTPDKTWLAGYVGFDGSLITKDLEVFPYHLFAASDDEKEAFNEQVLQSHKSFSVRHSTFIELYTPEKFSVTKIIVGDKTELGIYGGLVNDLHYVLAMTLDNELRRDCYFQQNDIQFESADTKDILRFHTFLVKHRLEWNHRSHTFSHIEKRVGRGDKYWYINDHFAVVAMIDQHTPAHDLRYKNGNYFSNQTEALLFLRKLKELRKSFIEQA